MPRRSETVPISDYAADWGVTTKAVTNWIAEGLPYRMESGQRRIVRADANRWLRERTKAEALAQTMPSEAEERVRKLKAEADLKELELQERRGELIPATDFRLEAER